MFSEEEMKEQDSLQKQVEERMLKGPTAPLPPIEEVNAARRMFKQPEVSKAEYDAAQERRTRARTAA